MITQIAATLYRGGPEYDARLHFSTGDVPGCAGDKATQVSVVIYECADVAAFTPLTPALERTVQVLARQLAARQMSLTLTDSQRARLCRRCAAELIPPPR